MLRFHVATFGVGGCVALTIPKISQIPSHQSSNRTRKHPAGSKIQKPQSQRRAKKTEGQTNMREPAPALEDGKKPDNPEDQDPTEEARHTDLLIPPPQRPNSHQDAKEHPKNGKH